MSFCYYKYLKNKKGDLIIKISVDTCELSLEKKSKIWKILSTNPYNEIKKKSQNIISYDNYKSEMVNEDKKQSMKDRYKNRSRQQYEQDDNHQNPGVQCAQQ